MGLNFQVNYMSFWLSTAAFLAYKQPTFQELVLTNIWEQVLTDTQA